MQLYTLFMQIITIWSAGNNTLLCTRVTFSSGMSHELEAPSKQQYRQKWPLKSIEETVFSIIANKETLIAQMNFILPGMHGTP